MTAAGKNFTKFKRNPLAIGIDLVKGSVHKPGVDEKDHTCFEQKISPPKLTAIQEHASGSAVPAQFHSGTQEPCFPVRQAAPE